MEEQMQNQMQNSSGGMNKFILPTVIIALSVFAAIGFYLYKSNQDESELTESPGKERSEQISTSSLAPVAQTIGAYKDGTYSVVGNYVSPGGPRTLNVKVTLANNVISAAEVEATATDATSKRFQGEFVESFKPQVIGKNINEVNLTKVAGSSLSPKGFNDAIAKIKAEATS